MSPEHAPWPDDYVILYDGACVLCSRWVRFVARRDSACRFRFTPIESPYGRTLARALGIDPIEPDTNAVIINSLALRRSDAALAVASALPGWRWVRFLRIVPRGMRNFVYDIVARNRYGLFGRNDFCDLGGAALEGRVLTCASDSIPNALP